MAITVVHVANVSDTAICHCTCPSCSYIDTNSNIIDEKSDEKLKATVTKSSNIDNMYGYLEDDIHNIFGSTDGGFDTDIIDVHV